MADKIEKDTAEKEAVKEEAAKASEAENKTETANNEPKDEKKKSEKKNKNETVKLKAELDSISAELAGAKDMLLRTAAEFDNFKRRTEKEKSDIAAYVKADVAKELLPVADNIGRAKQCDVSSPDYVKGLEMITKQLSDALDRLGLKQIDAEGKPFDPKFHEAVMHVEDPDAPENTVVQVLQAGYMIGDTVIRPAMVKVAN